MSSSVPGAPVFVAMIARKSYCPAVSAAVVKLSSVVPTPPVKPCRAMVQKFEALLVVLPRTRLVHRSRYRPKSLGRMLYHASMPLVLKGLRVALGSQGRGTGATLSQR